MRSKVIKLFSLLLLVAIAGGCAAQESLFKKDKAKKQSEDTTQTTEKDSSGDLDPIDEIITEDAITKEGLLTVHQVDDDWYFEVPDSLLGRDMLVVNRISKGPVDNQPGDRGSSASSMLGYAGDNVNKTLIRFEKGPDSKLFIRAISYSVLTDSTSSMYESIKNSNTQPIIQSLDIEAKGEDSSLVVEVSDLLAGNNRLFSFGIGNKGKMELTKLNDDRSYVKNVESFPKNTEIKTVRTYNRYANDPNSVGVPQLEPPQGIPESAAVSTLELQNSIILLPKEPMKSRQYDERVGYFATGYTDYNGGSEAAENKYMVTRWDLKPKEEDIEKYQRGELVEPKEPIVYYIDPATPDKWVPYLKQGVNDWQKAFEQAGFKNAIKAKEAPTAEEDSTWSLMDARYSAIVYKASNISNASGPHINDPRSGEILESHINWYHNVMELARDWYLVQASPSDPAARTADFDEELMGRLIRYVASHEVGHALGLRHNMGASHATPVEKLRDKEWLEENGHTSSIMDYARFNYVAQPQDSVGRAGLFPRINDYDNWAIEWGYKRFYGKDKTETKNYLEELTTEKLADPRLRFISGEEGRSDPRAQQGDLGNNTMKASAYGIENLKYIVPKLSEWVVTEGEDYSTLNGIYNEVLNQYFQYVQHVTENIGGVQHTPKVAGQPGEVYEVTSEQRQKEAVSFISEHVLQKPEWLFDNRILDKVQSPAYELSSKVSEFIIAELYNKHRLTRLMSSAERRKSQDVYTISEYMEDVQQNLWSELDKGTPISSYRRNLQNVYISKMREFAMSLQSSTGGILEKFINSSVDVSNTDIPSIAKYLLRSLEKDVSAALTKTNDKMTRIHLENTHTKIQEILEEKSL